MWVELSEGVGRQVHAHSPVLKSHAAYLRRHTKVVKVFLLHAQYAQASPGGIV